jgi:hypothetical protein
MATFKELFGKDLIPTEPIFTAESREKFEALYKAAQTEKEKNNQQKNIDWEKLKTHVYSIP